MKASYLLLIFFSFGSMSMEHMARSMPVDVWLIVFSYLNKDDKLEVCQIDKCFQELIDDHGFDNLRIKYEDKKKIKIFKNLIKRFKNIKNICIGPSEGFFFIDYKPINKYMTELKDLRSIKLIGFSDINNIDNFSGNKKLKELKICISNSKSNLSGLRKLSFLECLSLISCYSSIDINYFTDFQNLNYINLSGCPSISNLSNLSLLQKLKGIKLSSCQEKDDVALKGLSFLKGLEDLELYESQTCETIIANFTNLERLAIFFHGVPIDIKNLSTLKKLKAIEFNLNHILENIRYLSSFEHLKKLRISGCYGLESISCVSRLTNLEHLDLSNCPLLTRVGSLKKLLKLRTLNLSECIILSNIDFLQGLENLTTLDLTNCHTINIIYLSGLDSLKLLKINLFQKVNEEDILKLKDIHIYYSRFSINAKKKQNNRYNRCQIF